MTLKEEAYNELTSSETLNAIATEAKECAQRIASRVLDLAVQTAARALALALGARGLVVVWDAFSGAGSGGGGKG